MGMQEGVAAVPRPERSRSTVSRVSTARIVLFAALGLLVLSGAAFGLSDEAPSRRREIAPPRREACLLKKFPYSAERQAGYVSKARADMPAPVAVTAEQPGALVTGLTHLFGGQTDHEKQEAAQVPWSSASSGSNAAEALRPVFQSGVAGRGVSASQPTASPSR